MRLLFFSNVFPHPANPTKGPFNLQLTRALSQQHDVRVVAPRAWVDVFAGAWRGVSRIRDTEVRWDAELSARYPTYYYPPKVLRSWYGDCMWWSLRSSLRRLGREFQPEAVVSYWAHPDGEVATRLAREIGCPSILMVGGSDVLILGRDASRRRKVLASAQAADHVVAVSRNIADHLVAEGLPAERVSVLHRGVDQAVFHPGEQQAARLKLGLPVDRPVLVAVGRLVDVKGFDLLIDACEVLRSKQVDVAAYIVGTGPLEPALRERIADAELERHVQLVGAKSPEALGDWFRAADLTVLTSHSEGIPNVLLESIACGCPFVATDVGGVSEIADPSCHSLVSDRDPASLAEAIESRLIDPLLGKRVPRFQPLSWEESAARLTDLIGRVRRGERVGEGQPLDLRGLGDASTTTFTNVPDTVSPDVVAPDVVSMARDSRSPIVGETLRIALGSLSPRRGFVAAPSAAPERPAMIAMPSLCVFRGES